MQEGDLVRLKETFIPDSMARQGYQYGVITGIIRQDDGNPSSEVAEVLVQLCEGDRTRVYTDQWGVQPTYSFYPDEIADVVQPNNS